MHQIFSSTNQIILISCRLQLQVHTQNYYWLIWRKSVKCSNFAQLPKGIKEVSNILYSGMRSEESVWRKHSQIKHGKPYSNLQYHKEVAFKISRYGCNFPPVFWKTNVEHNPALRKKLNKLKALKLQFGDRLIFRWTSGDNGKHAAHRSDIGAGNEQENDPTLFTINNICIIFKLRNALY